MADKKTLELLINITAQKAIQTLSNVKSTVAAVETEAKHLSESMQSSGSVMAQLASASQRAAASYKLFGANSQELRALQQQIKSGAVELTVQGFKPESDEIQNLVNQYKALGKQADTIDAQNGDLFSSFDQLKSSIGSIAAVAAAVGIDKKIIGTGDAALTAGDSFISARQDFGILMNDMQAGAAVFDQIIKPFNDKTPFNLDTTEQAAKVLMSAKVQVQDLTKWLTRMGDLSQGNAQKMTSYVSAFSKASAKGKADMEVLNVYIDQGVPILDALAKKYGTTSDAVVDMVSKGKVSFKDFEDALVEMTDKGGQFYGGMELASKSYAAMQEGLKESVKSLSASFGESLIPAVNSVLNIATQAINIINDSPLIKGLLAGALTTAAILINVLAVKAVILAAKTWLAYAAQMGLNASLGVLNPVVLAATVAVAGLVAGITIMAAQNQKAAETSNAHALAVYSQKTAYDDLSASLDKYREKLMSVDADTIRTSRDLAQFDANATKTEISRLISQRSKSGDPDGSLSKQISSEKQHLADVQKEIEMYSDVLDQKQMSLVDAVYSNTDAGKIEKLRTQISQINAELQKGGSTEFRRKARAAVADLEKQIDELEKKGIASAEKVKSELASDWSAKMPQINQYSDIQAERDKAVAALNAQALSAYGIKFSYEKKYLVELDALNAFYDDKEYVRKQELLKAEQDARIKSIEAYRNKASEVINELGNKATEAEMSGSWGAASKYTVASSAMQSVSNTEAGQVAQGAMNGGLIGAAMAAIKAFIGAIINAISALENGKKALNFITTIVTKIFDVIGPMVNDAMAPAIKFFETLGTVIGKIIKPLAAIAENIAEMEPILQLVTGILEIIGKLFDWIWSVTKPFVNFIAKLYNTCVEWLNNTFGTSIRMMKTFSDDAQSAADAMKDAEEKIKNQYQKQIDAVNALLDAQINSIKTQYELGLITRDSYNNQASAYTDAATSETSSLEEQMNAAVQKIEENQNTTYETLASDWENTNSLLSQIWDGIKNIATGGISGIISDFQNGNVGKGIAETAATVATGGVYGIVKGIGHLFGWWDVGSTNIPSDQFGTVHKGEMIVPATFSDGIRRGDVALVGRGQKSSAGTGISVSVSIGGSVVTEKQIVDLVYTGISRAIQNGEKSPLPDAA